MSFPDLSADLQAKLDAGTPVRIAEVGCGEGLAAIIIAAVIGLVDVKVVAFSQTLSALKLVIPVSRR